MVAFGQQFETSFPLILVGMLKDVIFIYFFFPPFSQITIPKPVHSCCISF